MGSKMKDVISAEEVEKLSEQYNSDKEEQAETDTEEQAEAGTEEQAEVTEEQENSSPSTVDEARERLAAIKAKRAKRTESVLGKAEEQVEEAKAEAEAEAKRREEASELVFEAAEEAFSINNQVAKLFAEYGYEAGDTPIMQQLLQERRELTEAMPDEQAQKDLRALSVLDELTQHRIPSDLEVLEKEAHKGNPWRILSSRVDHAVNAGLLREANKREAGWIKNGDFRRPWIQTFGKGGSRKLWVSTRSDSDRVDWQSDLFYGPVVVDENGEPVTDDKDREQREGGLHGLRKACESAVKRFKESRKRVAKERTAQLEENPPTVDAVEAVINGEQGSAVAGYFAWDTKRGKVREFAKFERVGGGITVSYASRALERLEGQVVDHGDKAFGRVRAALGQLQAEAEAGTAEESYIDYSAADADNDNDEDSSNEEE